MELKKHDVMILVGGIGAITLTLSLFLINLEAGLIGILTWVCWSLLLRGMEAEIKEWNKCISRWHELGIYNESERR